MSACEKSRGQGAFEYIILLGGLVVIATLATMLSQSVQTASSNQTQVSYTQFGQVLANNTPTPRPPHQDTASPLVSQIAPVSASAGELVQFYASASDDTTVATCDFYWNGAREGSMNLTGNASAVTASYVKLVASSASNVYATCYDSDGKSASGAPVDVAVLGAPSIPPTPSPTPTPSPSPTASPTPTPSPSPAPSGTPVPSLASCDFESGNCGFGYFANNGPVVVPGWGESYSSNAVGGLSSARKYAGSYSYYGNVSISGTMSGLPVPLTEEVVLTTPTYSGSVAGKAVSIWLGSSTVGGTDSHSHSFTAYVCSTNPPYNGNCIPLSIGGESCSCETSAAYPSQNCPNYPACLDSDLNGHSMNYVSSAAGADGATWYKYSYQTPSDVGNSLRFTFNINVTKWNSLSGSIHTNYWLDDFCLSASNQPCSP
ncbi:MAG: class III signal peptide-containing protein [Candidatus Micrarchaeia archaeon]